MQVSRFPGVLQAGGVAFAIVAGPRAGETGYVNGDDLGKEVEPLKVNLDGGDLEATIEGLEKMEVGERDEAALSGAAAFAAASGKEAIVEGRAGHLVVLLAGSEKEAIEAIGSAIAATPSRKEREER